MSTFHSPFQNFHPNCLKYGIQTHESGLQDTPEISPTLHSQHHHTQTFCSMPILILNLKSFLILFSWEDMTSTIHLFYLNLLFSGSILGLNYKLYSFSSSPLQHSSPYFYSKSQLSAIVSCHTMICGTCNYTIWMYLITSLRTCEVLRILDQHYWAPKTNSINTFWVKIDSYPMYLCIIIVRTM